MGDVGVSSVTSVRNLGVVLDCHLSMKDHIAKVCKISCYHLRNIRRIRKFLTQDAAASLIHAFVTSQLDYCNSLLAGLPKYLINKLQSIQNAAIRTLLKLRKYDPVTPAFHQVHWLPVRYRIRYKVCLLVFKALHGMAPSYLTDMLQVRKAGRYNLRSRARPVMLDEQKYTCKTFGGRSFGVQGPKMWNKLPDNVRAITELEQFKRQLKTHLYTLYTTE